MKTNFGKDPGIIAVLGMVIFAGCGPSQDPSFVENRRSVKVDLTVNDEDATAIDAAGKEETSSAEQSADRLSSMDDEEVNDIFQSMSAGENAAGSDATSSVAPNEDLASGEGEITASTGSDDSTTNDSSDSSSSTSKKEGKDTGEADTSSTASDANTSVNTETIGDSGTSDGNSSSVGTAANTDSSGSSGDEQKSGNSDDGQLLSPNPAEIKACAKFNGVGAGSVKVVGDKSSASITSNSVVAIKVAGNQSNLDLSLRGKGSIAAICIFVTGNRGTASVTLGVGLGNFIYVGRGNGSSGDVNVIEGGSIANIAADLGGNGASLSIHGSANCGTARIHGNGSAFICK